MRFPALFLPLLVLLTPLASQAQRTIFVSAAAAGGNDGTSWTDAFAHLQDALASAQAGDEVWVAAGVYRPDQGVGLIAGDAGAAFLVTGGITLRGGFKGTESLAAERSEGHETVLSGDLLGDDAGLIVPDDPSRSDNSLAVLKIEVTADRVVVDRMTIADGNSDRGGGCLIVREATLQLFDSLVSRCAGWGGGLAASSASVVVSGSVFSLNQAESDRGGAIRAISSDLRIFHSLFSENTSRLGGGAIRSQSSSLLVSRSRFVQNRARDSGGAIHVSGGAERLIDAYIIGSWFHGNEATFGGAVDVEHADRVEIVNSAFSGNSAVWDGGSLMLENTIATLTNVTSFGSTAGRQGQFFSCFGASLHLRNSIVWSDSGFATLHLDPTCAASAGHSLVEDGLPAGVQDLGGNLSELPLFVDPRGADGLLGTQDDDLAVDPGSPAAGGGLEEYLPSDSLDLDLDGDTSERLPLDLAGNPRILARVDMGALEQGGPVAVETPLDPRRPSFDAYPNPASEWITIVGAPARNFMPGKVNVRLVDVLGRVWRDELHGANSSGGNRIGLRGIPAGLYFLLAGEPPHALALPVLIVK